MASRSKAPRIRKVRAEKRPKQTDDYRHSEPRPNNPDAGLQSFDRKVSRKIRYEYDPHLDPQLVWASKAEHTSFEVDTVSLHTHERISTQAILKTIQREPTQRSLFGDPELPLDRAVQFYEHGVNWANRLILGDSLLVMNSLLHRELMGSKVQMIYMDPPYGVSYNSNFQPRMDRREVKDVTDDSLTREPEQIRAYRDTWTLGVHSYLSYLRDRLLLAKELLSSTGSLLVQIGEENVHHVREVLDEVFGASSFYGLVALAKTSGATVRGLPGTLDFILWYCRDQERMKYRQLYRLKRLGGEASEKYDQVESPDGTRRPLLGTERADPSTLQPGSRVFRLDNLMSQSIGREKGLGAASWFPVRIGAREFLPNRQSRWKTNEDGMARLVKARRVEIQGNTLAYVRYIEDFPAFPVSNLWDDVGGVQSRTDPKVYVVQTSASAIARCLLMTTDPGDLVLDPTCGSGTTAYVAEQWGRRWITCDTSRVALSLARQRLMTATFPYYKLAYPGQGVAGGFLCEEVPHVTLKSIAQDLPPDREKLHDKPEVLSEIVRVSGPFTVEAINTLDPGEAMTIEPVEEQARKDDITHRGTNGAPTVNDHLSEMTDLLRRDGGINVPGKGRVEIDGLGRVTSRPGLHAEGSAKLDGKPRRVAITFGPRYGPVTARLVEEAIQAALGSYDALVVGGFSFDPEVSAFLDKSPPAGLRLFRVQIAPDVLVGDLLKTRHRQNLFAVIGEPDYKVEKKKEGTVVELLGVDVYDPNKNEVAPRTLDDVAAWFVDHDYDGRCFCVCQVFLPAEGGKAFEKLQRALKGTVDEDAWDDLRGFVSRPFQPGKHQTIAVKVIDVRGNEVVGVRRLGR